MKLKARRGIVTDLKEKYSVTELCEYLGIKRNSYYYKESPRKRDHDRIRVIKETFEHNKGVYGLEKLYIALHKKGVSIGRKKLSQIMKEENLVSKYVQRRKPRSADSLVNKDKIDNKINREFTDRKPLEVVASDLTYVDINHKWNYICLLIELSHREIIGYAAGENKDAELVKKAWLSVKKDIRDISIFHTDRGSEFKNDEIDRILNIGNIERSLSRPGKPIDNAVCESMYDIVKTEFVFGEHFKDTEDLQNKLGSWVWWYNNERLHSSLGYKTPVESRESCEVGVTPDKLANKKYRKFWRDVALHGQKVEVDK